jgi:hypothetical protein
MEVVMNIDEQILFTYKNDGEFLTHNSPDVDALMSLYVLYSYLKNIIPLTKGEFIKRVRLVSSGYKPNTNEFGVDIGKSITNNSVKSGDIIINGKVIEEACSSLYLGYHLLPRAKFDVMLPLLQEIHKMDSTGHSTYQSSMSTSDRNPSIYMTSLWGILGSIVSVNKTAEKILNVVFDIFDSIVNDSLRRRNETISELSTKIETYSVGKSIKFGVAPLNVSKRKVTRYLGSGYDAMIFSSYDPDTMTGTFGVTVSREFSSKYNIGNISNNDKFKEVFGFIDDIYISEYVVGKTVKSPISNVTAEKVRELTTTLKEIVFGFLLSIDLMKENSVGKGV